MESPDPASVLVGRIKKLEPQDGNKIIGYLLFVHNSENITEFAFGTDELLQSLIIETKKTVLELSDEPAKGASHYFLQPPNNPQCMPLSPAISKPFSSPSSFRVSAMAPDWNPYLVSEQQHLLHPMDFHHLGDFHPQNQSEFAELEKHLGPLCSYEPEFSENYLYTDASPGGRMSMRNLPVKPCHYFYKGFCKHGRNCRFFHDQQALPDVYFQELCMNDLHLDGHIFAPGSLAKLDGEVAELLREKKGVLVSTATLPLLYHEKYGKSLQADGYLTESQRHGKAGCNLTKLLSRLPSIRLIDKPHGQHSVVLLEDAPKIIETRNDVRSASGSSSQIYLTFPADSDFTAEDVSDYFNKFGPVRDVRIPHQERRMYGFVSFAYPDTVRRILSMSHPHIIKNSRVLVKPYKEKSRMADRKVAEKPDHEIYHQRPYFHLDPDANMIPRLCDTTQLLRRQLMIEEEQQAIELETRRLLQMQLNANDPLAPLDISNYVAEESKLPEDHICYPKERNLSTTDENSRDLIELLPDNLFASIGTEL